MLFGLGKEIPGVVSALTRPLSDNCDPDDFLHVYVPVVPACLLPSCRPDEKLLRRLAAILHSFVALILQA